MPRSSRVLSESRVYHIMIRGNERKKLFLDTDDRKRFIEILRRIKNDSNFWVYAYCLMNNHVHLAIHEGQEQISAIMQRIAGSYAFYFNKKYNRVGHVFQDRFKSEPIENDSYLMTAVSYIHNNPVKAKIVEKPEDYIWSSFSEYIKESQESNDIIVESKLVLDLFSENKEEAIKSFIRYSREIADDYFIDYEEDNDLAKTINGEKAVVGFIEEFVAKSGFSSVEQLLEKKNSKARDEMIRILKERSNMSVRDLSGILNLNRNIIQRA